MSSRIQTKTDVVFDAAKNRLYVTVTAPITASVDKPTTVVGKALDAGWMSYREAVADHLDMLIGDKWLFSHKRRRHTIKFPSQKLQQVTEIHSFGKV